MILRSDNMIKETSYKLQVSGYKVQRPGTWNLKPATLIACFLLPVAFLFAGCYSFKDVSIPPEIKTFRVNYIENKARYINPQLSPQLTDKLRQKINSQTRLSGVQSEDAHFDISGQVTGYNVT